MYHKLAETSQTLHSPWWLPHLLKASLKTTSTVIGLILALQKRLGSSSKYNTPQKIRAVESYWCNTGNCCEVKGLCYSQRDGKCDLPSQDSRICTTSPICRDSCGTPVPLKLYIAGKLKMKTTFFNTATEHSETEIHSWLLRFGYWDQYTRLDKQNSNSIKELHLSTLNNLFSHENGKVVQGASAESKNQRTPQKTQQAQGHQLLISSAQDLGALFRCRSLINTQAQCWGIVYLLAQGFKHTVYRNLLLHW